MLNRRILRIKAFKTLYGSVHSPGVSLEAAQSSLDQSCEATRDLFVMMMGIISPLTTLAAERIEASRRKFNPTEQEKNPNMKFAENALARLLDQDIDFQKSLERRKFSWGQYDLVLKKILDSVQRRKYYQDYMAAEGSSLSRDCALFTKIFEREFIDCEEIEHILEDLSIYWNDDLAYALTCCCRSLEGIQKTGRWELFPLYQSEMKAGKPGIESDRFFVHKLLTVAYSGYDRFIGMIRDAASNWDYERIVSTDLAVIVCGLAEAETFDSIPLKVTINEYVEIAKFYGTPKSSQFVNGMLDTIIQKMISEGKINKTK